MDITYLKIANRFFRSKFFSTFSIRFRVPEVIILEHIQKRNRYQRTYFRTLNFTKQREWKDCNYYGELHSRDITASVSE